MIAARCDLNGRSGHTAGWELLAMLFREETGLPLPEIRTTDRGKPYFPNLKLHFSISHTEHYAFCVLAHCPVGIDAEELDRRVSPSILRRALSAAELTRIEAEPNRDQAFLKLWVLKEAAVKMTGEGLRGFPNQTDYSPEDTHVRLWDGCAVAIIAQDENEEVHYRAV